MIFQSITETISASITIALIFSSAVWVECAPRNEIPKAPRGVGPDWYCETICEGGCGGRARYDAANQVCNCTITEHIDDGDMELIWKTAGIAGLPIKFDGLKYKRASDDHLEDDKDHRKANEDKDEASSNGKATPGKKFPTLKPLKPLFANLRTRFQPAPHTNAGDEPLLGQIDPTLDEYEPHHNVFAMPPPRSPLFRTPLLGQINPAIRDYEPHHNIVAPGASSGLLRGHSLDHLTPALTRSMLMSVREKLDHLIMRTENHPYQPAVTAHETESMRNTLKQITQVNVNVRPVGTTFGYFFNNLVNQLIPAAGNLLRQEAPDETTVTHVENIEPETTTISQITSTSKSKKLLKDAKEPIELGKKTSLKTTSTTAKFLPVEDGDDLVGEDADAEYEYDEALPEPVA